MSHSESKEDNYNTEEYMIESKKSTSVTNFDPRPCDDLFKYSKVLICRKQIFWKPNYPPKPEVKEEKPVSLEYTVST